MFRLITLFLVAEETRKAGGVINRLDVGHALHTAICGKRCQKQRRKMPVLCRSGTLSGFIRDMLKARKLTAQSNGFTHLKMMSKKCFNMF